MSHDALMKSVGISVTDGYERLMDAAAVGKVAPPTPKPPRPALVAPTLPHTPGTNRQQRRAARKKKR